MLHIVHYGLALTFVICDILAVVQASHARLYVAINMIAFGILMVFKPAKWGSAYCRAADEIDAELVASDLGIGDERKLISAVRKGCRMIRESHLIDLARIEGSNPKNHHEWVYSHASQNRP